MPHVKKTPISVETVETLAREILTECARDYEDILKDLVNTKPGTERHRELLCELGAAASWMEIRLTTVQEAIDEHLESLPNEDDDD
ncbi:MAG: hypothetical protein ACRD2G_07255 [Terriglobia bacterium]